LNVEHVQFLILQHIFFIRVLWVPSCKRR